MRYIVNADDLGRTKTVNQAIFEAFERDLITNATVMVNMPFFDEATELAKEKGLISRIGLHMNLTSGIPLTEPIRHRPNFTNSEGRFHGKIFLKKRLMFFLSYKDRLAVQLEVKAQIERYLDAGYTLKHADSHGHVHTFFSLQKTILKVLYAYGMESVRISRNIGLRKNFLLNTYKKWINRRFFKGGICTNYFGALEDVLKSQSSADQSQDVTEVMLHPNYLNGNWSLGEPIADEILLSATKHRIDYLSYIHERGHEKK